MTRTALLSNCLAAISVVSLVSFQSVAAKDAPPAAERTTQQSVASPDGSLEVEFALDDGVPNYSVTRFGRKLIDASRLGFLLKDAPGLDANVALASAQRCSLTEKWEQPWGEK